MGTGAVPVPTSPDGCTAGVKITLLAVATMWLSAPANPVLTPHGTAPFLGTGMTGTPPA